MYNALINKTPQKTEFMPENDSDIIYAIDGASFLRTMHYVNELLLKSAEMDALIAGDTYRRSVADANNKQLDCLFTQIKEPTTNTVIMDIAYCNFGGSDGFYCISQFSETFHILSENQMDTFVHIYTEAINCLLITLAGSKIFSDSESEQ